ncbi:hypothetical protein [Actinoplanes sp. NPDC026619]|uniref:hypothetical protein n=1 Tax=Actinoplanes sp. NPDC026619 TaxID=3155798 RepID=UPI0033C9E389
MAPRDDAERRLVRHYRAAVGQCAANLSRDLGKFHVPPASSPYKQDDKTARRVTNHKQRHPRARILTLNLEQSFHKIANVRDHLEALATVLGSDPPPVYAPSSLTRVIVEAAAGLHALLDGSIDIEERLLRASSALLESYHHSLNAALQLPPHMFPDAASDARRRLDALVKRVERTGLEVRRQVNGKPTGVRWVGASAFRGVPFATTSAMIEEAFSGYPALYQMGSGVAHSMEWMLGDNARIAVTGPAIMTYESNPLANGGSATAAVAATEVVISAYGRYMGFDPEDALVPYRRRRETLDKYMNEFALRRPRSLQRS